MFEYYITSIILIVSLYIVYKKYFDKDYSSGEWLEVNKDINIKYHLEWDISANSNIKIYLLSLSK